MRKPFVAALLIGSALVSIPQIGGTSEGSRDAANCQSQGRSKPVFAILTGDQQLWCLRDKDPAKARTIGALSGLVTDQRLVGIDVRPANGALYGIGDFGGVYNIDLGTATATLVSRSSIAPAGADFGVDFNPVADRLRVVSDQGQNLRINVDTGAATADTSVNYTTGASAPGVTASMYTNNDADPVTATTLFDIDTNLDQVVVQSPPNAGTLAATGKLGIDVSAWPQRTSSARSATARLSRIRRTPRWWSMAKPASIPSTY